MKVLFQSLLLIVFLIFGSLWYSSFVYECLLYIFLFLTAWLGAWDPVVLHNRCDLIWVVLCVPGIPGLWHSLESQPSFPYWASFWITDFGRLGLSFGLWNLKHFPFMGLWTLIPWTFSSFSSSFFLSLLQDSPMCYFSLGFGLWLILNLNNCFLYKWRRSVRNLYMLGWKYILVVNYYKQFRALHRITT